MNKLFWIILLILLSLSIAISPKDKAIAVIEMDSLGWYRVDNYRQEGKCIEFIDGLDERVTFCGAFKVTNLKDFYKFN